MNAAAYHTAFDKSLPTHIKALYEALKLLNVRSKDCLDPGHECDCEFCDEYSEPTIIPGKVDLYRDMYEESEEIVNTLRRCIRWANFKNIPIDTSSMHISHFKLDPPEEYNDNSR